jgi:pimeloyl-ACP methyl ester carboxylesterase
MPIVFVHGVNNRIDSPGYLENQARTESFLRSILAPRMGLDPAKVSIFSPYWGDHGVRFRWNQASVPGFLGGAESLGLGDDAVSDAMEAWLPEARFEGNSDKLVLGTISREEGFDVAIDLLWDTMSIATARDHADTAIADGYRASMDLFERNGPPAWAMQVTPLSNREFVERLRREIEPFSTIQKSNLEVFGLGDWFSRAQEYLDRLENASADIASSALVGLGRKHVHSVASRFLGDIFIYLSTRGSVSEPGAIVREVLGKLTAANDAKRPGDDRLIVIGHSLGGVIVYDILSHFVDQLQLDAFVSVGSQVALFEEMSLYRSSQSDFPANPPAERIAQPAQFGKWLNVYDTNDVFSFLVSQVFDGPTDLKFDTGYAALQAHGGYFARPSFYRRLATKLA